MIQKQNPADTSLITRRAFFIGGKPIRSEQSRYKPGKIRKIPSVYIPACCSFGVISPPTTHGSQPAVWEQEPTARCLIYYRSTTTNKKIPKRKARRILLQRPRLVRGIGDGTHHHHHTYERTNQAARKSHRNVPWENELSTQASRRKGCHAMPVPMRACMQCSTAITEKKSSPHAPNSTTSPVSPTPAKKLFLTPEKLLDTGPSDHT